MADLKVTGRMKVKSLKKGFLEEFGLSIRIYDGRSFYYWMNELFQAFTRIDSWNV